MASRFWVGGAGTWDNSDTSHWAATSGGASGASVPGAADTVNFDVNSGNGAVATNYNVSVTSILCTAGFTGSLTLGGTLTVSGIFRWQIGSFSTAGFAMSAGVFDCSSTNVRALTLDGSTITLTGTSTILAMSLTTNLTFSTTGTTWLVTDTSASTKTLNVPLVSLGAVTITGGGSGSVTLANRPTITTLTVGAPKTIIFTAVVAATVTNIATLVATGTAGNVITFQSSSAGSTAPLRLTNCPTAVYCAFQDITCNSAQGIDARTNCTNNGNNHNVLFATPKRLALAGVG